MSNRVATIGRPTSFTPAVQAKIIASIRAGNYYKPACATAGIRYETFRNWMNAGQDGDPIYVGFFQQVQQAEAEAEQAVVAQWLVHMPEDYKAARDFLARRHPERWAEQSKRIVQHEGAGTTINVITLDVSNLGTIYGLLQAAASASPTIDGDVIEAAPRLAPPESQF